MDSKEFVESCIRTESKDFDLIRSRFTNRNIRLLHAAMGLCTEAAEFLDVMKKHLFYGKSIDEINLLEELGDSDWYKSIGLDELGKSFEEIWEAVIFKLAKRYGANTFSANGALERDLKAEREILDRNLAANFIHYYNSAFGVFTKCGQKIELVFSSNHLIDVTCPNCHPTTENEEKAIDVAEVAENVFEVPDKLGEN